MLGGPIFNEMSSNGDSLIEAEAVSKSFGGLTAVDNVDMAVNEGEILAVIGPNGAGKTTLFNIINGFLEPDIGSIEMNGRELTGTKPNTRAKMGMARTFQLVKVFEDMTPVENVMVGSFLNTRDAVESREQAEEALHQVGYNGVRDVVAEDLDIVKKKQIELARALAINPEIILLDEILAGLNTDEINHLLGVIQTINDQDVTILLIEHVMEAVMEIADRIVVLNEGQMIADGEPAQIANDATVIEAYLGEQWSEQEAQNA